MGVDLRKLHGRTSMGIHEDLLTNMPTMRAAISRRFRWYIHVTEFASIGSIRSHGLQTQKDSGAPSEVQAHVGATADFRLCFNPAGADLTPGPTKNPPFVCLAIERRDLPGRLGLDCTTVRVN